MDGILHSLLRSTRRRRPRFSSRPFYLVLITLFALTLVVVSVRSVSGLGSSSSSVGAAAWTRRDSLPVLGEDPKECRLVRHSHDQCAYVLANCGDHDIGLLSYLQLYYCKLAKAKAVAFILLTLWLALLFSTIGIAASDFLCINLSTIASILGMSESLTGVTFLAFGNGSPDVFSTFAAMGSNNGSLALGELLGAACFITAVVAGSMALVRPFRVARRSFVRDVAFFIAATCFSLVFLGDGKLVVWECVIMITFYVFYVIVVVSWHWYLGRQRRQRERDIAARAQFHIPENQELDINEEPEEDDDPVAGAERPVLLGASTEDFSALESARIPAWKVENTAEEDDEAREHQLAELQGSMRVSRAPPGQRGSNIGHIRPSLVGALEFRSVLSSLQRSRNFSGGPILLRRYSDEPGYAGGVQVDPEPDGMLNYNAMSPSTRRERAVSAYEQPIYRRGATNQDAPGIDTLVRGDGQEEHLQPSAPQAPRPDLLHASPTSSGSPSRSVSPARPGRSGSPNLLAPPEDTFRAPDYQTGRENHPSDAGSSAISPRAPYSKPSSGSMSPVAPFPPYQDDAASFRSGIPDLRLPSASAGSIHSRDHFVDEHRHQSMPPGWWPTRVLPTPAMLAITLFPTLSGWKERTLWDKFLAIAAAPSIFALTITLPVVEPGKPDSESPTISGHASPPPPLGEYRDSPGQDGSLPDELRGRPRGSAFHGDGQDYADANMDGERRPLVMTIPSVTRQREDSELPCAPVAVHGEESQRPAPKIWNRWLLAVQLVTAPLFITWTVWANLDPEMKPLNLIFTWLCSLGVSCVLLIILFLTTKSNSTQVPATARPLLAFLGFIVAIAWISTIATEVVSLLKTFGVILDISDSLLGLTVFAVGNSLGDLVADITVAKLGYPVMALSACFGGPMLNILLGIGLGGLYMTLNGSPHTHTSLSSIGTAIPEASPIADAPRAYHIDISRSLLISGLTLLVTLGGLLIVVPLNRWWMDRKIGFGLVVLWCVSTACNVIMEVVT